MATRPASTWPQAVTTRIRTEVTDHVPAFDVPPGEGATASRSSPARLAALEHRLDELSQHAESQWELSAVAGQLRRLRAQLGRPQSVAVFRMRGRLHHQLAWCSLHAGFTQSAVRYALHAVQDHRTVYRETLDPQDLLLLGRTALVLSHAYLMRREPAGAEAFLSLARHAAETARAPAPADLFRQAGVAAFQRRNDRSARLAFGRAALALGDQEPESSALDLYLVSTRHTVAMEPVDWDGAREFFANANAAIGLGSLQLSMTTHWTVAAGLGTDSPRAILECRELLEEIRPVAARFGHQATIHRLLTLTSELRLSASVQGDWIRWVMYANAFAQK
jgi:hypothetical protein